MTMATNEVCDADAAEMESSVPDTALTAFLIALRLLEYSVSEADVRRRTGIHGEFGVSGILDAADACGVQAERAGVRPEDVPGMPSPALAEAVDGSFLVVVRSSPEMDGALAIDPVNGDEVELTVEVCRQRLTGTVVLVSPRSKSAASKRSRFGFASFLPGLLRYKGTLGQLLGASLFIQLFAMITPLFTMVIIDKVLTTGAMSTLNVLIIALAAVALFDVAIGLLRGSLLANVTHRIDAELGARLFRYLVRLPMSYFGSQRTGDTVSRVREIEAVRQFLTGPSLTAIIDFGFALLLLLVMALFSVPLTLIVLASVIAMLALYAGVAPMMKRRLENKYETTADSQSFLVETIGGIETVKSLSLEPQMQRDWEDKSVEQTRFARESENMTSSLSQVAQFINKGTVAITLWLGAHAVIDGTLTAGQLIAFNMMVGRVMAPALRLAQLFQQLSQTRVSVQRLAEIFDVVPEPVVSTPSDRLPPMRGAVRFEHVTFRYQAESPEALHDVSFEVRPGEVIGVVGASGAGKSSLLRLLQRLYVPSSGRILIDGVNIAEVDPVWLRRHIGAITQDSVLFNATIRENIVAAQPDMPIETVERVARLAAADDFIRELPGAYDTVVGERGCQLSVGQRQRISLARALAAEPKMLLLDEPTSSLDAVAESRIQENLTAMVRDRTVFLVAHRLSTLRICDRILVFESGRLVEQGAPSALLSADGAFARLKKAQREFGATAEVCDETVAT